MKRLVLVWAISLGTQGISASSWEERTYFVGDETYTAYWMITKIKRPITQTGPFIPKYALDLETPLSNELAAELDNRQTCVNSIVYVPDGDALHVSQVMDTAKLSIAKELYVIVAISIRRQDLVKNIYGCRRPKLIHLSALSAQVKETTISIIGNEIIGNENN